MIKLEDILFSATKILSNNFSCDVIIENQGGVFENECFYVTVIPVQINAFTKNTDRKSLIISIKYFGGNKLKNYSISDTLYELFGRDLKVKNDFINISNIESTFLKDEVGDMLDFLIYLDYSDYIYSFNGSGNSELMGDINISTNK